MQNCKLEKIVSWEKLWIEKYCKLERTEKSLVEKNWGNNCKLGEEIPRNYKEL